MGMFCKLGLMELNRPVVVTVCVKLVCILLVLGLISCGKASMYVDFNLYSDLYSKMSGTMGCLV